MKEAELKFTRFNNWVWRTLPTCKEVVKLLTSSMDRRLTLREWFVAKLHLHACDSCVNFLKQIKFIRSTLLQGDAKLGEVNTSVKLGDDARIRIKKALESSNSA